MENKYVKLLLEEDILIIEFKPECEIYEAGAIEVLDLLEKYCGNLSFLVLEDMSKIKWIDKKSRDLFASHPIQNKMAAWAYYSEQPIHKLMYTIYETFSRPSGKTAFFSNKEEAKNWLGSLRN